MAFSGEKLICIQKKGLLWYSEDKTITITITISLSLNYANLDGIFCIKSSEVENKLPGATGYHMAMESTQGPKPTVTWNHSYNSFPFQGFKTSQENKWSQHSGKKHIGWGNYLLHLDRKTPTEGGNSENPSNHSWKPRVISGWGKESGFIAEVGATSSESPRHGSKAWWHWTGKQDPLRRQDQHDNFCNPPEYMTWFVIRANPRGCRMSQFDRSWLKTKQVLMSLLCNPRSDRAGRYAQRMTSSVCSSQLQRWMCHHLPTHLTTIWIHNSKPLPPTPLE